MSFNTPPEVSELLAELLDPQPKERICDPTCGSGSLLIKCARHVGSNDFSLYGQESNGSTWALAKMNMFLHGIDNARVEWGDTLRNPQLIEDDHRMRFEVVVANPPFYSISGEPMSPQRIALAASIVAFHLKVKVTMLLSNT